MKKGYLMAHLRVHDEECFEKFRKMAGPTIAEYGGYGGKVLVREPNPEVREGKISGIALVIEFDSIKKLLNSIFSKYNELVILCAI